VLDDQGDVALQAIHGPCHADLSQQKIYVGSISFKGVRHLALLHAEALYPEGSPKFGV
jgi:hypothetical protein